MELTDYQINVINAKICPYCKSETRLTTETVIYGKEYKGRKVICCKNFPICDSYVGTHDDNKPLGRLANKELRNLKKQAHVFFDKIWKENLIDRDVLYMQLASFLKLPLQYTHIGMFQEKTCLKVEKWAKEYYNNLINKQF